MTDLESVFLGPGTSIYVLNLAVAAVLASAVGLAAAGLARKLAAPVRYWLLLATVGVLLMSPPSVWHAQRLDLGFLRIDPGSSTEGSFLAEDQEALSASRSKAN